MISFRAVAKLAPPFEFKKMRHYIKWCNITLIQCLITFTIIKIMYTFLYKKIKIMFQEIKNFYNFSRPTGINDAVSQSKMIDLKNIISYLEIHKV